MKVKVFGEARTGTTYLEALFDKHGFEVLPNGVGTASGWKHGLPTCTQGALHVLLMRDVYEWVRSMATGFDARWNGLTEQFGGDEDHWGVWKHPLECRTAKYISYINFASSYGAVLLNTEYLKAHPSVLTDFTGLTEVDDITEHVRLGIDSKDDPARPELTDKQVGWIDEHVNRDIEVFVEGLTCQDFRE